MRRSVVCYGIPDFTGTPMSGPTEQKQLVASLETAIRNFEPRFLDLKVVLEPINPAHIGKVAKLPALVAKIQAMQAQVDGMNDEHGKALASRIGTHAATFSTGLRRILAKVGSISAAHKAAAKQHR